MKMMEVSFDVFIYLYQPIRSRAASSPCSHANNAKIINQSGRQIKIISQSDWWI